MGDGLVSRTEAIRILEEERAETLALLAQLSPDAMQDHSLGGGTWSPTDLIGHLESWEEHALEALDAWARDEPAPIDRALGDLGVNAVNAEEVRRKAEQTPAQAIRRAAATRAELIDRIGEMDDAVWGSPATSRARKPLGHRVGQILVGTQDPFRHDGAHLRDLRNFVADHGN